MVLTSDAWDDAAADYDRTYAELTAKFASCLLEITFPELSEGRAPSTVLDVCGGSGALSLHAAQVLPRSTRIIGTDFSPKMVEILAHKAKQAGYSNLEAKVMDGQELSLSDGSVDAVFNVFGIFYLPDCKRGCEEMFRILRSGGTASVAIWTPTNIMLNVGMEARRRFYPAEPASVWSAETKRDQLVALLMEGGFVEVQVCMCEEFLEVKDYLEFFADFSSSPVFKTMVQKMSPDERMRWNETVLTVIKELIPSLPAKTSNIALFVIARKP